MKPYRDAVVASFAALIATAMPLQAQSTTWNLGSFGTAGAGAPAADACRYNNTSVGNVGTCDAAGASTQQLKFRGYSFSGSAASSTVAQGTLNTWGASGIGMCNTFEAASCGTPNHSVDNFSTYTDFVVFEGPSSMALKSVTFGWTDTDADFTVLRYTGAAANPYTLLNNAATTLGGLLTGGWSVVNTVAGNSGATTYGFNSGDLFSQYWIVATYNKALYDAGYSQNNDAFKISSIKATLGSPGTSTITPEPSTYALMTAGLIGLFAAARRRRA